MGTVAELPTVQVQGLVGLKGDSQLDIAPEQLKPGPTHCAFQVSL